MVTRAPRGPARGERRAAQPRALAAAAALALAGCASGASPAPLARPLTVQVPMLRQIPCPAATLADPPLPIAQLKPDSPPADTMRAYAAAVAILKGAVRERDAMLAGCAGDAPAAHFPAETVR